MKAKHGTLNVHRADCNRQHANPCDPWSQRRPRIARFLREKTRCSTYSFQECLPEQAVDITTDLGWGTSQNPAWWADENFNVVAADRTKWTDLTVAAASLLRTVGDVGDRNRRSVLFVQLHRLDDDQTVWIGGGHLETGDPAARALQAAQLADAWPRAEHGRLADAILGIDRNSFTLSKGQPRDVLARAGIREALPTSSTRERSFNGFGTPEHDGKNIDGLHYSGRVRARSAALESTVGTRATDHSGLTLSWELS